MTLYSVDPGVHSCWAAWEQGHDATPHPGQGGYRLDDLGEDALSIGPTPADSLVIEDQVIIPRFTKNPKSIIALAHNAGAIAHCFGWPDPDRVRWVLPRSWKGSTRKPTSAKNWASYTIHRMVVMALNTYELSLYTMALSELPPGARHDMADAVGIGLWALGRLKP